MFTATMTGNVVMLGMALLGGADLPVVRLALAPAGYLVGAALAAWVLRAARGGWSTRTSALLGTVAGVVSVLALVLPRLGAHPADPVGSVVTSVLAMAMGMQGATAGCVAVEDVTAVAVVSSSVITAGVAVAGHRVAREG